jgi:BASS family bile acid:Na+ symporter
VVDQGWLLSLVLAALVFSVALELRRVDFLNVAQSPRGIAAGLIAQFLLLPVATWLATLLLNLSPATEAALILVATCPGGAMSNVVTHHAGGNTAMSVSLSAIASVMALVLTPFNFAWMMAGNPVTAAWLHELQIDAAGIWWNLLLLLGVPMLVGLWVAERWPHGTVRIRTPMRRASMLALLTFILVGLYTQRATLDLQLLLPVTLVVLHNLLGLTLGHCCARAFRLQEAERRAVIVESGMQNSGLALGIIAVQFHGNPRMVVIAALWGIWHLISGLSLAFWWRAKDARSAH